MVEWYWELIRNSFTDKKTMQTFAQLTIRFVLFDLVETSETHSGGAIPRYVAIGLVRHRDIWQDIRSWLKTTCSRPKTNSFNFVSKHLARRSRIRAPTWSKHSKIAQQRLNWKRYMARCPMSKTLLTNILERRFRFRAPICSKTPKHTNWSKQKPCLLSASFG